MSTDPRRWITVGILCGLYFVSYVDRLVLALVADAVKADLRLSDPQLALLIGLAFAGAYATLAVPAGWAADRVNRPRLIAAGAVLWGGATIASAFSTSFGMLVVLRTGVAVGEVVLTPAAISLLADLFEGRKRTFATSIYLSAGVAGGACAYLISAGALLLAEEFAGRVSFLPTQSWRVCLIVVGAPALMLGTALPFILPDPVRRTVRRQAGTSLYRHLAQHRGIYAVTFFATPLVQLATFSFSTWYPSFLHRTFGYTLPQAGLLFGAAAAMGGVAGTILGPNLAVANDASPARMLRFAGRWALLATPFCIAAPLVAQPVAGVALAAVALALVLGVGAFPPLIVQMIAPPDTRAILSAIYALLLSLIGFAGAPLLVTLAERLAPHGPSLAVGISVVSGVGCVLGGIALSLAYAGAGPFSRRSLPPLHER